MEKLTEEDRAQLEQKYGEMTDKFWHILVAETAEAESDQDLIDIITDVYTHAEQYEREYEFWEAFKKSDKSPESMAKLLKEPE